MDIIIKQRILGILVLVAIAVVLVPALMSGNASVFRESMKSNIPEKPAFVIDLSEEQKLRVASDNEKMAERMARGELGNAMAEAGQFPLTEALSQAEPGTIQNTDNATSLSTNTSAAGSAVASDAGSSSTVNNANSKPARAATSTAALASDSAATAGATSVPGAGSALSSSNAGKQKSANPNQLVASKPLETTDMSMPSGNGAADAETPKVIVSAPAKAAHAAPTVAKTVANTAKSTGVANKESQQGWIVQVASFKKSANAEALKKRLARHGMQSSVVKNNSKNGMLYRVRLGPWDKKQLAAEQQAALEKIVDLDTLVLQLH